MANGRMITNLICRDKRINQLSSDTGRLAFTWLITFADREGRVPGDPAVVRSMVFPRRQDVSIEQMEAIIQEWHTLGLVLWYEAEDDKWIWFPSFDDNQKGLRKDREAPSKIPPPPARASKQNGEDPEQLRSDSGQDPEQLPVKLIEEKGKEIKGKEENPASAPDPFDAIRYAVESKGILLAGKADIDTVIELVNIGATPEDVLAGIEWKAANNNGKAIRYLSSLVGPTKTAMAKRLQSGGGCEKEFSPSTDGRVTL
jgi:hypothetical protein